MISQVWSFALTAIGLLGLFLTMRKNIAGPFLGLVAQALWITYAIVTFQLGFILSAVGYGVVNLYGIRRWRAESKKETE